MALGSQTPLTSSVVAGGSLWLEIEVEGETLTPRQPLLAVPFALQAEAAESLGGISSEFVAQIYSHFAFDGSKKLHRITRMATPDRALKSVERIRAFDRRAQALS